CEAGHIRRRTRGGTGARNAMERRRNAAPHFRPPSRASMRATKSRAGSTDVTAQGRDALHGQGNALLIDRQRLRRHLGNHQLVRAVDKKMLTMDAESEHERPVVAYDVPLAAVVHGKAAKQLHEVAAVPSLG